MATLQGPKPDPRITGQMVLMNWLLYRRSLTSDQIRDILGLAEGSTTVQVYHRFDFAKSDSTTWEKPQVTPEFFLWNWQPEARKYLRRRRLHRESDTRQIDSWIQAISEPSSRITPAEASELASKINEARR